MRKKKISETIGNIDPKYITEAATDLYKKANSVRRPRWLRWGAVAACLAIALTAGARMIPTPSKNSNLISIGGVDRNYKDVTVSGDEFALEWRWEYKTIYEKYPTITFNGGQYQTRARAISKNLLGGFVGNCTGDGFDFYTGKNYTETFEVYQIPGISDERLIAVGMEDEFYVYLHDDENMPSTLGELLDAYNLTETMNLDRFSKDEDSDEKGYYVIDDDAYLWQILSECRDAEAVAEDDFWNPAEKKQLSFTVTSEELGVYKRAFSITEDGYVWTNIFNYRYLYRIGEDAAGKITDYATKNATEAEFEPYEHTLAGTLTELGDGYLLLDDSALCADESEGMVFKVPTDDLRIRRCLEFGGIEVGEIVVVKFTGAIDLQAGNVVEGATSMYEGELIGGDVAVPE